MSQRPDRASAARAQTTALPDTEAAAPPPEAVATESEQPQPPAEAEPDLPLTDPPALLLAHDYQEHRAGRVVTGSPELLTAILALTKAVRRPAPTEEEPEAFELVAEPIARWATPHEVELAGPLVIALDNPA